MKMGTLSGPRRLSLAFLSPSRRILSYQFSSKSDPIVQIAVETKKPNDIPLLLDQLRILNNNDSSIRVFQMVCFLSSFHSQKTGEHIISAVGELQLDVIINDLRKRLKDVELVVSPPSSTSERAATSSPLWKREKNDVSRPVSSQPTSSSQR